jgi:hypothetical protein
MLRLLLSELRIKIFKLWLFFDIHRVVKQHLAIDKSIFKSL